MTPSLSIEVSSCCDRRKVYRTYCALDATQVFVTWRHNEAIKQFCETCVKLSEAGLNVVPHMVARNLGSADEFQKLLLQFNQCSGIKSLLLLSGDAVSAAGPYHCAMDLLSDENFWQANIKKIFVAGYPQGHAFILREELDTSLQQKVDYAHSQHLELEVITQLCTSMADSVGWALATKARHNMNVRVSVPVGGKGIIERRLKQIYQHPVTLKTAKNHGAEALAFLASVCEKLRPENTRLPLHLIPFHNMDTLLSYTNEINTMLKSKLS